MEGYRLNKDYKVSQVFIGEINETVIIVDDFLHNLEPVYQFASETAYFQPFGSEKVCRIFPTHILSLSLLGSFQFCQSHFFSRTITGQQPQYHRGGPHRGDYTIYGGCGSGIC